MTDSVSEPQITLTMLSQPRFLSAARSMVANLAQRLGFNEVRCGQISLAVDEALCNIINHGYQQQPDGRIWIYIHVLESERIGLKVILEDEARQVEPDEIKSRDLEDIRPGGLGVFIIREVMDEVRYEKRNDRGMRLTLVKWLPDEDETEAGADDHRRACGQCHPSRRSTMIEGETTHER
jgi:serine/threonine-protein kinase RsbW